MSFLIAVASKHGSTLEMGKVIADELRAIGCDAICQPVEIVRDIADYDAVIVGSSVYVGRWMPAAEQFVIDHQASLSAIPVWLFSSGPLSDDYANLVEPPAPVRDLASLIEAKGHRIFNGRLDPSHLGLGERIIAKVVHAPAGDFRDWEDVREWAREIGEFRATSHVGAAA